MVIKRTIAFSRLILLVLAVCQNSIPAFAATVSEYQIKAAFLYNFAKFIDWPSGINSGDKTFKVGILGRDPFGDDIRVIEGKRVRGAPLDIVRSSTLSMLHECQVVFLSSSVSSELERVLKQLKGKSVLTVSDTSGFADRGVMINLITVGNKVRFQINPDAAERAGLKISSHLLRLALIVD